MSLREDNFVVIDIGSHFTKAGMDMRDTNKRPTHIIPMADYNNPIKNGEIQDWTSLEASWDDILFKELGIKRSRNMHPVLFTVPVRWTKEEHERIVQIAFEKLNVPGIYIARQPQLALFGCGAVSGTVIDIGEETTDISIVVDSIVLPPTCFTVPTGGRHFDQYLLKILQEEDAQLVEQFRNAGIELDETFARFLREQDRVCVPSVGHEPTESLLSADIATGVDEESDALIETEDETKDLPDTKQVEYKGHTFTVSKCRHKAYDPLFSPELLNVECLSLVEAMMKSLERCEPSETRSKIWESIVLTGGCSLAAGLQRRIKAELQNILPQSVNIGDTQPRVINFLRIPDYFPTLKEKESQHLSTWLGGEIVAKLIFIDHKNYISKLDYNEYGPSVAHRKC